MIRRLKHLLGVLTMLVCSVQGNATHVFGANIETVCLGGGQYEITLHVFQNCNQDDGELEWPVRYVSGCSAFDFGQVFLDYIPGESQEVSQLCETDLLNSTCNGGLQTGILRKVFRGVWTAPTSCEEWKILYIGPGRNQTVNITDPNNDNDLVVFNDIITSSTECNDSPVVTAQFIPYVCLGEEVSFNLGAYDIDGDSLVYSFSAAQDAMGNNPFDLSYEPGFSAAQPIPGITLDPQSGQLSFSVGVIGEYTVAIRIEEYDNNGNWQGSLLYDFTFVVLPCTNPPPEAVNPELTNFSGTATQSGPLSIDMCSGETFCADYLFSSVNPDAVLTIESNINDVLPGASLTVSGDNPITATICWQASDLGGGGSLLLIANDGLCPIPGIAGVGIEVSVTPSLYAGPDTTLCPGQNYQLAAIGGLSYAWTSISGDPLIPGVNISCLDCPDPIVGFSQETTIQVTDQSAGASNCPNSDQITISFATPQPDAGPDASVCGLSYQLEASEPEGTGSWIGGPVGTVFTPPNAPDAMVTVPNEGPWTFFWQDDLGGGCIGTDQVEITFSTYPVSDAGGAHNICGTSGNLQANSTPNGDSHWYWTDPDLNVNNPLDPNSPVTVNDLGTYTLWWIEDNNGCTDTSMAEVTFLESIEADAGPNLQFCGDSGLLAGGNNYDDGSWEYGGLPLSINDWQDPNATITNLGSAASHDIEWITGLGSFCEDRDTLTVTFDVQAIAFAGDDVEFCGTTGQLNAGGVNNGLSQWIQVPSAVSLEDEFDPNTTINLNGSFGSYELIWLEDQDPCTHQDTVLVTFSNASISDAGSDQSICGISTNLNANGNVGDGEWDVISGLVNIADDDDPNTAINVLTCGETVVLSWTLFSGNCSDVDTVLVSFECGPDADAGNDVPNYCGSEIALNPQPSAGAGTWSTATTVPSVTISNPNDPYTTIIVDGPGTVILTWTETFGACTDSDDVSITFNESPTANAGEDDTICALEYQFDPVLSFGNGFWFGPAGTGFDDNLNPQATVSVTNFGTYEFVWNETTASCGSQDTVSITFAPQPNPNAGLDIEVCSDEHQLEVTGVSGTGVWTVNPNDVTFNSGINASITTVSSSSYGVHEFIWTETIGSCIEEDTVLVTFTEQPTSFAGNDTIICALEFISQASASVGSGEWTSLDPEISFGDISSPSTLVSASIAGTYTLTWTETNGSCIESDDVIVTFNEVATTNAGMDQTICGNQTALDASTSFGSGIWSYPAGLTVMNESDPNSPITATTFGTFDLEWIETAGLCSDIDSVSITFIEQPTAFAGNDTTFCSSIGFTNALSSIGNGMWTGSLAFGNANMAESDIVASTFDSYELIWTETNQMCMDEDTVIITFTEQPMAEAGEDETVCGSSITLEGEVPGLGSGQWTFPAGMNLTSIQDPTAVATVAGPGLYILEWTVTNGACVASDEIEIEFFDIPIVDAGPDTSYCGLSGEIFAEPIGVGNGSWSGPIEISFDDPTDPNALVTSTDYGQYPLSWTESGTGNCAGTDIMLITFYEDPFPSISLVSDTICGLVTTVVGDTQVGAGTWSGDAGLNIDNPTSTSPTLTASAYGTYTLTWTVVNGSCSAIETAQLTFVDGEEADAGPDVEVCGAIGQLNAVDPLVGIGYWDGPFAVQISDTLNPQTNVDSQGSWLTYEMYWMVSSGSCVDVDTALVTFTEAPIPEAGEDQAICGLETQLGAVLSTGIGTWVDIPLGATLDDWNPNSTVTVDTFGDYVFTWQEVGNGCTLTDTVTISFNSTPIANAGADIAVCGWTAEIEAIPSTGIGQWLPNPDVANPTPDAALTTVTVTEFDEFQMVWLEMLGNCSDSDTMTIDFIESPIANAGEDIDVCGLNVVLDAQLTIGSGEWTIVSGNASLSSTTDPNALLTGTTFEQVTLSWKESDADCSTTDTLIVNFYPSPDANAGTDFSVCGLTAEVEAIPSFGDGSWQNQPGLFILVGDTAVTTAEADDFTTYDIVWLETENGCTDTDTVSVTFIPPPIANAGLDEEVCGPNGTLGAQLGAGSGSWVDFPIEISVADVTDPESDLTASQFGEYILVWEESDGICSAMDSVTFEFYELPMANAGIDFELCGLTAELESNPSVGDGVWTGANSTFSDPESAMTSVTVTNGFGDYTMTWTETNGVCTDSDQITISFLPSPTADAGEDDEVCGLAYDLGASLSSGSGNWTAPSGITISLTDDPQATIIANSFGAYDLIWTEFSADCFSTDTVTITFLETPSADAGEDLTFCGPTGTLAAIASIGVGGWDDASGQLNISPTDSPNAVAIGPPGTYTLTWTEENGQCSDSDQMVLTLHEIPEANAGPDDAVCGTSYSLQATPSVGNGIWTSNAGVNFSPDATSPNATVTVPACGVYTFQWSEENANCTDNDEVEIQFNCAPDTSGVNFICINSNTEYQLAFDIVSGDAGSYSVSGMPGNLIGSFFLSDPISTGAPYSFTLDDQFSCLPIILSGMHSCPSLSDAGSMSQDTIHACEPDEVTATYNQDGFMDPNDALMFVLHDNPIGLGNIFASDENPHFSLTGGMNTDQVYYISAVVGDDDGSGAVDLSAPGISISIGTPIIFHSAPSASVDNGETALCDGQSIDVQFTFSGVAPFNLSYDYNSTPFELNGIAANQFTFQANEAGTVTPTYIEDAYCVGEVSGDLDIVVYQIPSLSVGDTLRTCSDDPSPIQVQSAGNGPWTFDLYIDQDFQSSITLNDANDSFLPTTSGTYELINLNDLFCSSTESFSIGVDVVQSPALLAGADAVICQGETVQIGEEAVDGYVYSWTADPALSSTTNSQPQVSLNNATAEPITATFGLTVTNDICETTDEVDVTVNPLPIDFGIDVIDSICEGETLDISAYGGTQYLWLNGIDPPSTNAQNVSLTVVSTTNFVVEISNEYSCSVQASAIVEVNETPDVLSIPLEQTGCIPLVVNWTNLTDEISVADCEWIVENGEVLSESCDSLVVLYDTPGVYYVDLLVTSPEGCSSVQPALDSVIVTGAFANILFNPSAPTIDDPDVQLLDATIPDATTWSWIIDGEEVSNEQHPIVTFDSTTVEEYEVCLAVVSDNGCPDTTCIELEIGGNFQIWVPNAFTPNGDDLNEVFKPVVNHPELLDIYEFKVFDRRGHIKFESTKYNEGWDGINVRDNGIMQGMYQWEVKYRESDEFVIRKIKGHVNLLK